MKVVDLLALTSGGPIAVVAPHPDDETLGCGGLIALAAARGVKVVVVVLTGGQGSHQGSARFPPDRLAFLRADECQSALGVLTDRRVSPIMLGLRDGDLEATPVEELGALLGQLFTVHGVKAAFVTGPNEDHPDHRAAFRATQRAAAASGAATWCYPVWSKDEPALRSNRVVGLDISGVLQLKRRAIARHRSQTTRMIRDAVSSFRLTRDDLRRHQQKQELFWRSEKI